MSKREYAPINLTGLSHYKVIVGEGESDRNFFAALCAYNGIDGFQYAFTGMHNDKYDPSGFDCFFRYLPVLSRAAGFSNLQDIVLVCDRTDNPDQRANALRRQIRKANTAVGRNVFSDQVGINVVAAGNPPRTHVLMIPHADNGGLESVCFSAARDHLNEGGRTDGTQIEGWVNGFATNACVGWTTEKRDKLRLQAFISAASKSKPEMHFSQLFDITRDRLVPLRGAAFDQIKAFLQAVAAL